MYSTPCQVASDLGTQIRQARVDAGLRREDMAVRLNVGLRTVQRWETGESDPSIRRLGLIAQVTGKPLDFFLRKVA